ncbi:uncharacterized protein LOC124157381 isoform X2 [Ischnura elegans]|uniref:uncharacterized protein LOC124157381 isoform X2 n=1 Tax=Ischnura elegans TaxID=197161 RepID=UPI001ED8877D|nr:uncharacterized protein LOC124157381 isoform X2 [Ischnura elegans]
MIDQTVANKKKNKVQFSMPLRPRTAFSTSSFHALPIPEKNFKRRGDFPKYFDSPPLEQWNGILPHPSASSASVLTASIPLWRKPKSQSSHKLQQIPYFSSEETLGFPNWSEHDEQGWNGASLPSALPASNVGLPVGVLCASGGMLSLALSETMRLDMTIERSIRIVNYQNNIVLAISGSGSASALRHPKGCMYQYGSRAEILAHDPQGNHKYAKMWYKGVSFTCERCALVYLVDSAGTRTTTDTFSNLSCVDFSLPVFYDATERGSHSRQAAMAALQDSHYWISEDGIQNWVACNVRISLTPDGLVRVARNSNKYQLKVSETSGTASLTTPYLHCTASLGKTSHLFVRRGERRMHYDGATFIVRNAGHSAGFDDKNQLKVY